MVKMLIGPEFDLDEHPQKAIELSRVRPEQDDIGERGQIRWSDIRQRNKRMHRIAELNVSSRRRPCQGNANQNAHHSRTERKLQSIDQRAVVLRTGKGSHKILDAEFPRQAEGRENQPQQRIADEEQQQGHGHAQHQTLQAEALASGVRRCDGAERPAG